MNINQMFIGTTKQVHMISNRKYLNKANKHEAVTAIQNVSLMSQNNLILTEFCFMSHEIHLETIIFFEKIVNN